MCSQLHFKEFWQPVNYKLRLVISAICRKFDHWRTGCTSHQCLRAEAKEPGCNLTTLFATVELAKAPALEIVPAPAKKTGKNGWLPVLTVLFLISYALMTMLIVEQGRTIDSQRALIRELFRDSTELSAIKHRPPDPQRNAPTTPYSQVPAGRLPSTQAPRAQAPSSQTNPQVRTQNGAGAQKPFRMPSRPASDLAERARTLITI